MIEQEWEAWLRLKLIPGLGNASLIQLLQGLKTPQAILAAPIARLTPFVSATLAANIVNLQEALAVPVQQHLDWLSEPGHYLLTLADDAYPKALLDLPDPPVVLFANGDLALLASYALAMIGSRHPTEQGLRHARNFAKELATRSMTIVSGLAAGIDAAAHEGALLAAGKTIAVVGTGLDRVYPATNRALAHQISAEGLILSEFILGTAPKPAHFPARNRLIAALSRGCLVVEAALKSGSLITARQALELGREVFAIPGSIHSPLSKGCHALIKSGAKLVESVDDIVSELRFPLSPLSQQVAFTATDHTLLKQMGYEPVSLDELATQTAEPVERLAADLLLLEVEGLVSRLTDGRYQRCI